ncbi:insulinase family protein [Telmatocola sphagniphila]|uniref:Insulinase family protein n=1 Tax=Telmatocola sphagniphila TaxID=1123043 RepID=A0A8E6B5W6_9BACT|nr:pitrilysin family protein [Telmatocola sphagniphila]QVL32039.1 insulinase family protein [Telmatocola sphagniphila]
MNFHQHVLPNGLQIIGETNPSALSAAVAFWVRTGGRDETPDVLGVSHFLEHMVFKGTQRRNPFQVNRDFSLIGADNNAFTSEENTVFHAAVLPEYLPQLVDVLADIMRPSLREEDFNTEKKVILDEIVRYSVQPQSAAYDRAREFYFRDHPLGNQVLGTTESITALTRDQMQKYFDSRYTAGNIHAIAVGNYDWEAFTKLIEKACGNWPAGQVVRQHRHEVAGPGGQKVVTVPAEKSAQEYVIMMAPGPAADHPLRYASAVLSTIVGDYTGSRLYWALVDPGLADNAGMGSDEYDRAGCQFVSYSCDPENAAECLEIAREVLAEVQKNGITEEELQQAKTKIASREVRAGERTSRRMFTIAKDWAYLNQYRTVDDELRELNLVTRKSISEALERYPIDQMTTTAYGPLEKL